MEHIFLCEIQVLTTVSMKVIAFWDIALVMEAVRTSETLVYYNETTRRNIREGYYVHIFVRFTMQWYPNCASDVRL
jgi:hypothetical protein